MSTIGPHYLVLFLRHAPPDVELCEGSVAPSVLEEAIAITHRYGARWGEVSLSRCIGGPRVGAVRVQFSTLPEGKLGRTHTDTDAQGYATTSVVTLRVGDNVKLIAHELSHAQGIADVCHYGQGKGPNCDAAKMEPPASWNEAPAYPRLDMVGHLMHPDADSMGLDVVGMRWAVKQIYAVER